MHCETLLQLLDNAGLENGKRESSDKDITAHMLSCPHCSSHNVVSPLVDALRAVNEPMRRDPQSGTGNAVMSGSPEDDGSDKGNRAGVRPPSPVISAPLTPDSNGFLTNTPTSPLKNNKPVLRRRGTWLILLALLVGVLLLSCVGFAFTTPISFNKVASNIPIIGNFFPQATVTITLDSHLVSKSYVVTGVTDPPNAAQLQISAPQPTTSNQSQATVNGTGVTHIVGQQAAGSLTFFNAAIFSQTVAAGTTFTIRNGVQIISDQAAVIPAGNGVTNGSATVPAHATPAGLAGNIPAFTLNVAACCATGIAVSNTGAFTRGADQKVYNFVKQSDVDAKVNPLRDQLVQQSTSQLKAKIAQGEVLIGQPQCQPNVKADQPIGDQGTNIPSTTITVSVNCSEQLYNQQQLQKLMENQLKTMATSQYGPNYELVGAVQVKPTIAKINQGSVNMLVEAKGIWVSQPNDAQQSDWAKLIAGKTPADAISLLQSQKGISKVSIQVNGNTLPSDPNKIVFSPEKVNGLPAIANPSVNTNPTINNLPNGDNQTPSEPGR